MESGPWMGLASELQKYRYQRIMPRSTVCVCGDCYKILVALNMINR